MANDTIYKIITDKVLESLKQGKVAWVQPWAGTGDFVSHTSGKSYSLLNIMLLTLQGGKEGEYLKFKQCKAEGGTIKKGAKAKMVVFYTTMYTKKETDEDGNEVSVQHITSFPILKHYNVFHISDCEGIKPKHSLAETKPLSPIEDAETVINEYQQRETGLTINRNDVSNEAYYRPSTDTIVVPCLKQYADINEYYSTLFHEAVHSTGIKKRCDRGLDKVAAKRSDDYSKEELVAEMGAAMLIGKLGLDADKAFKNSVAYLKGWLNRLQDDPRMIVSAACKAEKAVHYILGENKDK